MKDGHGRLKNNLWTEAERPPTCSNVVVEPPGMPSIVGEVQLHLREILVLKEFASPAIRDCARELDRHAARRSARARCASRFGVRRRAPRWHGGARVRGRAGAGTGERKDDDAIGCGLPAVRRLRTLGSCP